MTVAAMERPMGKKKSDKAIASTSVKIHDNVLEVARIVATGEHVTITDLISEIVMPELLKRRARLATGWVKEGDKPK